MTRCSLTLLVMRMLCFGIYGKLASSNLYGSNLSWGMVDELGQQFGYDNTQDVSYYLNRYQYTNQQARNIVDAVWSNMYNIFLMSTMC